MSDKTFEALLEAWADCDDIAAECQDYRGALEAAEARIKELEAALETMRERAALAIPDPAILNGPSEFAAGARHAYRVSRDIIRSLPGT